VILYPNWSKKIAHLFTRSGVSVSLKGQVTYLPHTRFSLSTQIWPCVPLSGRVYLSVLICFSLSLNPLSVVYLEFVRLDTSPSVATPLLFNPVLTPSLSRVNRCCYFYSDLNLEHCRSSGREGRGWACFVKVEVLPLFFWLFLCFTVFLFVAFGCSPLPQRKAAWGGEETGNKWVLISCFCCYVLFSPCFCCSVCFLI